MAELDQIDNQSLIANGLQHMAYEVSLPEPSYFRIAREAHLALYRSMIEALKGSANLTVSGRLPKNPVSRYQAGRNPWREVHRTDVAACKRAWRFSEPVTIEPPDLDGPRGEEPEDHLIGFYDALAMVQSECFMTQVMDSRPVPVDDESMGTLEWLHESVRNEYEHFVPKYYAASVRELMEATRVCLRVSSDLLFRSGNVRLDSDMFERLQRLLGMLLADVVVEGA